MTKAKIIKIYCAKCRTFLYKYIKNKPGNLIKCYVHMIVKDNTQGDMKCPTCNQEFARLRIIRNYPAHKIIQGKVYWKK